MDVARVLKQLATLGTAQNRKVYARHGVRGEMHGVSYADLDRLTREHAGDHELALALWASGNHDARVLATRIADPARMQATELARWAKELDNYVLTDALGKLAAQSPHARKLLGKWIASKGEWTGAAGWGMLGWLLTGGTEFPQADLTELLEQIEERIHSSPNRVRYAMNGALIGIGVASESLRTEALAVARRIGPVEVDHGETGCKTPDAAQYIHRVLEHRGKQVAAGQKAARPRRPRH